MTLTVEEFKAELENVLGTTAGAVMFHRSTLDAVTATAARMYEEAVKDIAVADAAMKETLDELAPACGHEPYPAAATIAQALEHDCVKRVVERAAAIRGVADAAIDALMPTMVALRESMTENTALLRRLGHRPEIECPNLYYVNRDPRCGCPGRIHNKQRDKCRFCLGAKGGVPGNENRYGEIIVCDFCTALLMRIEKGLTR